MIKSEKGFTMYGLVVSVLIMMILAGASWGVGYSMIKMARKDTLASELELVRQSVIQQYAQANAVGKTNRPYVTGEQVEAFWVGEPLKGDAIDLDTEADTIEFEKNIEDKENQYTYQEDYYYRLNPIALAEIGITDTEDTYVVHYRTGEVYNETKKADKEGNLLYLPPIVDTTSVTNTAEDKESFNDWNVTGNE